MEPKLAYKFCPKCGGSALPSEENYTQCSKCGFKLFINASVGVGAIITNDQGQILLVKRGENPGKGQWDVPGGFVNPFTESMEEATVRETKEEVGLDIKVLEVVSNDPNSYLFQDIKIPMIDVFLSAKLLGGEIKQQEQEVTEYGWFNPDEALKQDFWAVPIRKAIQKFVDKI